MALKTKLGISQYTTQKEEDKTVYKITLFQTKATPKFCYAANILYKISQQDFLNCLSQKVDIIYVRSETNNTCIIQSAVSRTIHPIDGKFQPSVENMSFQAPFLDIHIYENEKVFRYLHSRKSFAPTKSYPCTMRDFFEYQDDDLLKNVFYQLFLCWGEKYPIWRDLAKDFENGSAYASIPLDKIFASHNKRELMNSYYRYNLKRVNKDPIGDSIFLVAAQKHVKEDDLQKLFGYHLSSCLVGRNKDVLIKILSNYIYNYALERWTKLEAKASRNRIIEIDKNFIYDAVHTSFLLKKKIPLSFYSVSGIKKWHDSVAIEYRNKNLPKVLIPKQSVFNDLQLPSNCVRLISKNMFAEEGLVQNNCVAFYIERVNKDQCSIWSMRKEDGTRNTIEIRLRKVKKHPKGIFVLAQMKGFNNSNSPKEDIEQIKKALKEINSGR